uniref:Uncharacterized protein n=1 Tax=uncultured bacterium CSLC2 TaxID=1091571 RepID=G4WVS8_9BACT|nr:hypothetical protein [uncultured bacterium CSLC2]
MNSKLIISILLTIAGIVLLAIVWFFLSGSEQQPAATPNPAVTLPSSGSVQVSTSSQATPGTPGSLYVSASVGGTIRTTDFIHNGITIPDGANKGRYLLAGNLEYCVANPQNCQAGPTVDYNIFYDSNYGTFSIALLKEPIGEVRLQAERFLQAKLGLSAQDMCRLNYYIGTASDVNASFATQNLGFSFCPGAVVLPK